MAVGTSSFIWEKLSSDSLHQDHKLEDNIMFICIKNMHNTSALDSYFSVLVLL